MSANDDQTLPFIRTELDWIPTALGSGKPFLGICLGAQLLARTLGATVAPHPESQAEIGYFPVVPTRSGREYFDGPLKMYLGLPVNTTAFPSPALEERISEIENRLTEVAVLKEKVVALETELGKSVA